MRKISEYTLIGNYLIFLTEKFGQESIKYENAKMFCNKVLEKLNKTSDSYNPIPIEEKMNIVKTMISRGVFKTEKNNGTTTFKQVYDYEPAKYICAVYSSDGNLSFRFPKNKNMDKDLFLRDIKKLYSTGLGLDLQSAMRATMAETKPAPKGKFKV